MAHPQQQAFCEAVKAHHPEMFKGKFVVDIGSLDINGNNQYLFESCLYLGVDLAPGRNVDLVTMGHELKLPDESVDTVISTECFEHDPFWELTMRNVIRMLKPGGLFLFSCATTGRPEHGTRRTSPHDAPFIQDRGTWGDYYRNLTADDVKASINVADVFFTYDFSVGEETHDLYFLGRKRGQTVHRTDYSFLLGA